MNTRRPAHAYGVSWRKWQDPLMYGDPARVDPVSVLLFWAICLIVGATAGLLALPW